MALISLLTLAVIISVAYVLIIKADVVVTRLELDEGFAETSLQLDISIPSVLRIAIIVTGALILVDEVPQCCRILYEIVQRPSFGFPPVSTSDWSPLVFSVAKIVLGLLLIGERNRIMAFIQRDSADATKDV